MDACLTIPGSRFPYSPPVADHRTRFLQLALRAQALRFGEFTLKSGRVSPYFFNAGQFNTGAALAELAACYADAVEAAGLRFDLLFGPAFAGRRALIVDDVITAGTAIRESLALIAQAGGQPAGIAIALDREEAVDPARSRASAAQTVAAEHGLPVIAVARLRDLLAFVGETPELVGERPRLLAYRDAYGSLEP